MTEQKLQADCFMWALNTYPQLRRGCLFHVPNGGTRHKIEAMQMKATGVVAGIPDLILLNKGKCIGIELKIDSGAVSDKQKQVHQAWKEQSIEVFICWNLEEFKQLINNILNN